MRSRTSKVAILGMLFALSIVLSVVETGLSGLVPIPGIKLGLSNIVIMYCLFFLGKREAFILAVLKAFFVLLRSPVGAAMSFAGGMFSVAVMTILLKRHKNSELFISICGGVFHNVGQLIMASIVLKSNMVFYYFPILAISGIVMGSLTGILLRYLTPYMNRMFF